MLSRVFKAWRDLQGVVAAPATTNSALTKQPEQGSLAGRNKTKKAAAQSPPQTGFKPGFLLSKKQRTGSDTTKETSGSATAMDVTDHTGTIELPETG